MINLIRTIVESHVDQELPYAPPLSPWGRGSNQQAQRMALIAELSTQFRGDLCEIGCLTGNTTVLLAEIARRYNRRVIAVDPWVAGEYQCVEDTYNLFLEHTKEYRDIIDVVRLPSQHEQAIQLIKSRPLCFAYVDGRHERDALATDLDTVHHARVICVDDLWSSDLKWEFDRYNGIHNVLCKEGYIVT